MSPKRASSLPAQVSPRSLTVTRDMHSMVVTSTWEPPRVNLRSNVVKDPNLPDVIVRQPWWGRKAAQQVGAC